MAENRPSALPEPYIGFAASGLGAGVEALHISSSQPPSSQPPSDHSEQSYQQASSRITQRRPRKSSLTYGQQAAEITEKSRKSLTASQLRRPAENPTEQQKWAHILQKFEDQERVTDQIIDAQNAWNKGFKEQQDVWNESLEAHAGMVTSQIDDFKNEFKSSLDALSQSTIHTQNRMDEFSAENRTAMDNLARLIQQQQPRSPRLASSEKKTSRFDKAYGFSASRSSSADSLVLPGSKEKDERFRESDIGYFNPTCSETHGKGDYVTIGDKIHYRNVWLFIEAAKSIAATKGGALIRINLHRCLRGDAQSWYITELTHAQRTRLHEGHSLHNWEKDLAARFKMREAEALALLTEEKYTVEDVRRQRQITTYVQNVIRRCKDAGIDTVFQQLNWAWNHLDPGLQRDITRPTTSTTVLSFIEQVEDMQNVWRRYYVREAPPKKQWQPPQAAPQPYNGPSANQGYYPRGQQYSNDGRRYADNSNPSYSQGGRNNQQWGPNNQRGGQDHNYQRGGQEYNNQSRYPANPSPANKQRLIEAPPRQASWQKPAWTPPASTAPSAPSQAPAYYNSYEDEMGPSDEEAYQAGEVEEHHDEEQPPRSAMAGVFFNDTNEVKYGVAPLTCQHCPTPQSFGNKDELRDHVLDIHQFDIRSPEAIRRLQQADKDEHAEKHVYNFSPPSSMGYATIQASIFGWELTPCLDTGGGVSLCDPSLVPRGRDAYGLVKRARPITITGVAGMRVLDKYIEEEVLLGPNKVPVVVKAYLVEGLQPGLIIGMNVLNRGDIDLMLSRKSLRVGDIDIPLCYAPPPPPKETNSHYSYHFMAHDIPPPYTRRWKPTPCLIARPRSPPFSTNEKPERPNSATPGSTHQPPTSATSKASHMEPTLAFNRKSADSGPMCQSTGIEANSFKNRGVSSNSFPRKCRHCKQFFTSGNLLHRHLQHCNGSTKGSKHARIARKLDGPWRKRSN